MSIRKSLERKLFSQSLILTIGTTLGVLSMFLYRVIFYKKAEPLSYSIFLLGYSLFLFYRTIGFMNVGSPLSNDVNKNKDVSIEKTLNYFSNGFFLIATFSVIADILMLINLFLVGLNWYIITIFCLTMITTNINNLIFVFYNGLGKIGFSAFLLSFNGLIKPVLLFILSYFVTLDQGNITLIFAIGELISLILSGSSFYIWSKKNDVKIGYIKFVKPIFKLYFKQCISIMLISLSTYGIRSLLYVFVKFYVSEDSIGFIDVPLTVITFLLSFFVNIGIMLTIKNNYVQQNEFLKMLFKIILSVITILILYEVIAYFVKWDNIVLHSIFNLDGDVLAQGVAIMFSSFPFLVIYYIINGYQQGLRKYKGMLIITISSFLISIAPIFILVRQFGLVGSFWGLTIYSVLLCVLSLGVIFFNNFIKHLNKVVFDKIMKIPETPWNKKEIEFF